MPHGIRATILALAAAWLLVGKDLLGPKSDDGGPGGRAEDRAPAPVAGGPEAEAEAQRLLERVGLGARRDHYPVQLSGGEQQRVALARAFMNRPKILFCDEPTGNLDGATAQAMADLIFGLNEERGTTLVLVTHDPELARRCRRILRFRGGAVVGDETT